MSANQTGAKKDVFMKINNRIFLASAIFGVALVFLLPEEGVPDSALLNTFTSRMMDMIPSIDRISRWSIHPRLSELFLSIMWVTLPFQTLAFLFTPSIFRLNMAPVRKQPWRTSIFIIVSPILMTWVMVFLTGGAPEENQTNLISDVVARYMQNSKFWLGCLFGFAITIFALLYAAAIRFLIEVVRMFIFKSDKENTNG